MRAIDFSCNLLKTLNECELSSSEIRILFCVAAGLQYKDDIARFLETGSVSACICTMKRLSDRGLIHGMGPGNECHVLTHDGRALIKHLLRFLPPAQP
ncbi:MAG: hypothetical protein Q4F38_07925 [Akkermansia sp.]|nr:hypothetical protein [Akkermansia sp.]